LKTIREESLAQLLRASIRRVSISDAWADKMLAEVERWTLADTAKQADLVARQKVELAQITARLDRLLEVFIDGTIGKDDFTGHKEKLTHEKSALAQSITDFEVKGVSRFKPLVDFITASRQAKYDAQAEELEELRNWHKKIGSNLIFAAAILEKKTGEREALAAQVPPGAGQAASQRPASGERPRGGSAARSAFQTSENPQQSGFFSTVEENESRFIPILPADVSAVASSGEVLLRPSPEGLGPAGAACGSPSSRRPSPLVFRSLGSRTDPVLHVRFPRPWSVVAENRSISNWRRGRDSNPRYCQSL
jgi:hypothetical protein